MPWATLGFSRVTCAHTCQNPYPHPQVCVFAGMGRGFTKTHRYPNLCSIMPPELTNEPHKGSASVNRHCCAACEDQKVARVQSMHPSVGDWGGRSMLLVGCSWWVVHILCNGQSLFVNGLGECSSSFGGFEGMQLLSFVGSHPHFVLSRVVVICRWLEWALLIAGGLLWVMGGCFVHCCGHLWAAGDLS